MNGSRPTSLAGTDDRVANSDQPAGSFPNRGSAGAFISKERASALQILKASWDHRPRKTFALFSGGNDSAVLAHWAQPYIDGLVYIDTGTALPGVRGFVEGFARRFEMELLIYEAGDAFERLVTEPLKRPVAPAGVYPFDPPEPAERGQVFGFPGPGHHLLPYTLLKERQIRRLVRDFKQERGDRIALLTGVRRAESLRRMGTTEEVHREGATLWVAPLLHWSDAYMSDYRERFNLPQSDVAALIHRSGECNCGAFAAPGEREMLADLWPEWDQRISDLERRAEAAGAINCRWGKRPPPSVHPAQERLDLAPGPMCVGCDRQAA